MTKRTTEQQRARELQRTAREQGTDLGYHEALNWVREAAETQARFPDMIAVPVPHDLCVMTFKPDTDPEVIRRATTPISEAERELQDELIQRRNALMDNHSKGEIVAMILRRWRYPGQDLTRWTKQELAGELVHSEDDHERYEAYGRVALHNRKPFPGSRSLCGGVGCSGHDSATPWPDTRACFRAQGPCLDAQ
ncbi:hypothetical protein J3A78_000060 [Streptomyces sp. PvR006]|uniref:hypothetical protein n=1 Tax=Streptomyces sp. PvR006 TaxID=2817860 RepID=UPI001AEA9B41|nr:hypothetical protein [Streptomyces sp. PvR006]MBP2579582.1 hypothetical protein [Streptomyces sp. PvR006]